MTYTATTALPYPHLERATAGLHAELRRQLPEDGILVPSDWTTLSVEGAQEFSDTNGHTWFGY